MKTQIAASPILRAPNPTETLLLAVPWLGETGILTLRPHTNVFLLLTRLEVTHFTFESFPIPAPMVEKGEEQD